MTLETIKVFLLELKDDIKTLTKNVSVISNRITIVETKIDMKDNEKKNMHKTYLIIISILTITVPIVINYINKM